jgi:hypothetical protein
MDLSLEQEVWRRAGGACEYCRMPQTFYRVPFQVDHIIARQHGGQTAADNLALACLHDNKHKGPNIASIDPVSGQLVPLWHPRRDRWADHFVWDGPALVGRTPVGRATVRLLAINHPDCLAVRAALIDEGVFPPR